MFSYLKTAAVFAVFSSLTLSSNALEEGESSGSFVTGAPCTPCEESDTSEDCVVNVKINFFASETGMY